MPLKRLTYDRIATAVTHRSDKSEGRTAAPFVTGLIEIVGHIVNQRYVGAHAGDAQIRARCTVDQCERVAARCALDPPMRCS